MTQQSGRTPIWTLVAVATGAVVVTLLLVFVGLRLFIQTPSEPPSVAAVQVAGVQVAATPIQPSRAVATVAAASPVPAAPGTTCSKPFSDAQSLGQAGRWSDAATMLETVRGQCDVTGPLYDAYLNQARGLADQERSADAISMFDKALQVKSGTEATNERALAVAYQDGGNALQAGDFDDAIDKLSRVQSTRPDYARGNNTLNLINAYLSKGDALSAQSQCSEALGVFQQALQLKPNESAIAQRVTSAQRCIQPTVVPAPAIVAPAVVPVAPVPAAPVNTQPLEGTVRAYYDALNSRRFADAYSMLSSGARATQSYAGFAGRFSATRSIGLRYVDGIDVNGATAGLSAHTQTVTDSNAGPATSCSRVVRVLVVESGTWRRDIRSESGNEFGEAC
jgi:hypothetical protein